MCAVKEEEIYNFFFYRLPVCTCTHNSTSKNSNFNQNINYKNYYLFPSLFFKASKYFCIPEHDHDFYRPQQTYDIENPGYGLGQAQKSGWVKPVNR
jgi:hypothetical protein